jgi:hypothetical protein
MRTGLIALVVAMLAAVAGPATASTRVAVAPFEGDRTGDLQDVVIEILEADYRIMPRRDVTRAIDKLGFEDIESKKELAKLALELDADAVIVGSVEPDGSKSKLTLLVYVAAKKSAVKMSTRLTSPRQLRESSLGDDLRRELGAGGDDRGKGGKGKRLLTRDGDDDDKSRTSRKGRKGRSDDDDADDDDADDRQGRKGKRSARRDDRDGDDDDDDDSDDDRDDDGGARATFRTARKAAVRVEVGVSGTGRQLSFVTNLDENQRPPGYKSNLVPGARFHAEMYPLALQNPDGMAAGLGLAADYDRAIGLTTTSSLAADSPLTTTSQFWSVGVRYRIAFGKGALNPSFTLGIGYGKRKFTVDRAPLMGMTLDLPDVAYKYLDPSLAVRIPIHTSAALTATGRFLAMRDTGQIGRTEFYGQAKVTGVDIEAGLEFLLGRYVLVHISGVFTQLGYTFAGGAVETNNRDGNNATIDVGGARDRYFGAMGTVGVVY